VCVPASFTFQACQCCFRVSTGDSEQRYHSGTSFSSQWWTSLPTGCESEGHAPARLLALFKLNLRHWQRLCFKLKKTFPAGAQAARMSTSLDSGAHLNANRTQACTKYAAHWRLHSDSTCQCQ